MCANNYRYILNTLFSSSPKKTTPSLYSDSVDISRLTDLSILLVDPNIASRHAVKSAIAHSGATKIREITDGNSVRLTKMVSSTVWDIIVCEEDFAKGQSGTAILDALREEGALSHRTIFMIMSNLATHERVVLAAENVADDFLQKK